MNQLNQKNQQLTKLDFSMKRPSAILRIRKGSGLLKINKIIGAVIWYGKNIFNVYQKQKQVRIINGTMLSVKAM